MSEFVLLCSALLCRREDKARVAKEGEGERDPQQRCELAYCIAVHRSHAWMSYVATIQYKLGKECLQWAWFPGDFGGRFIHTVLQNRCVQPLQMHYRNSS